MTEAGDTLGQYRAVTIIKRYADEKQPNPWELGATLYMPATRKDIAEVVLEGKYRGYALWLSAGRCGQRA